MKKVLVLLLVATLLLYGAILGWKILRLSGGAGDFKMPAPKSLTVAVEDRPSALLAQSVSELARNVDLEIRIVTIADPALRWERLAAGDVDLAFGTLDSFTLGCIRQKGIAVVARTAIYGEADSLVCPASVKSLGSLAGKRIALVPGSAGMYLFSWFLEKSQLPSATFRFIPFFTGSDALDALTGGKADAAVLWEPYRGRALKKGFVELVSSKGTRIVEEVLAASPDALASKRAKVISFLGAWFQLGRLLEKSPGLGMKLISRKTSLSGEALVSSFTGMGLVTLEENQAQEPEKLAEKMKSQQQYWLIEGEENASALTDFMKAVSLEVVTGLRIEDSGSLFGEEAGEATPTPSPTETGSPAESPTSTASPSPTGSPSPTASPSPTGSASPAATIKETAVYFGSGSFELDAKAQAVARNWAAYLKENPGRSIVLKGSTDGEEIRSWSPQRLSEARARRIQEELTRRGVEESRISLRAQGVAKELETPDVCRRVEAEFTGSE